MTEDAEARRVANRYRAADPTGERTGKVIRHTVAQITVVATDPSVLYLTPTGLETLLTVVYFLD